MTVDLCCNSILVPNYITPLWWFSSRSWN